MSQGEVEATPTDQDDESGLRPSVWWPNLWIIAPVGVQLRSNSSAVTTDPPFFLTPGRAPKPVPPGVPDTTGG
jgi:hypothetical protein